MIETSLCVVSACLPTLRPLSRVYTLQNIMTSLRSIISRRDLIQLNSSAGHAQQVDSSEGPSDNELG